MRGDFMPVYKEECDRRLVELTLCGDSGAFEELVVRHTGAVLGTAFKITGNHYSAEDAAQEAFAAAWLQLKSLTAQDKFGSYVCAIAKNYAKKAVMRDRRAGPMFSLTDYENRESDFAGQGGNPEDAPDDGICDQLHEEVEGLSDAVRETVKLHYFTGLSVKEVSARLGVPEGTVKWRLSEGRKQLQKGFGIVNRKKKAAGETTLVNRVMRQIQELELWQMKNNRQGIQEVYRSALEAVEGLQDERKDYLLASILSTGVQFERSEEQMARWKQAILDGHNDPMMCHFTSWENYHLDGQEKIDFMREVQIPYLREHKFPLSVGYVNLMMAFEYFWEGQYAEALETVRQAKELLEPSSDYYANAVSAVSAWNKMLAAPGSVPTTRGEHIRNINGSLYYCESPGIIFEDTRLRDFSRCDGCILDAELAPGESKVSSCGHVTYTFKEDQATVETPAGVFGKCRVYEVRGEYPGRGPRPPFSYYSTIYFCEGIGPVCQKVETNGQKGREERSYLLSDYEIRGGEGWFPLCRGNRWSYTDVWNDTHTTKYDAYYEVTSWNGTDAMLAAEEITYTPESEEVSS